MHFTKHTFPFLYKENKYYYPNFKDGRTHLKKNSWPCVAKQISGWGACCGVCTRVTEAKYIVRLVMTQKLKLKKNSLDNIAKVEAL